MNILSINTANKNLFLALEVGQQVFSSTISAQQHHNEAIIPAIDVLLKSNNLTINDIDKFGVVVGPGSFTGIRVGIATIKAFRDALGKTAVEINNLDYLYTLATQQFGEVGAVAIKGSADSYFVAKLVNGQLYKFTRNLTKEELMYYAENKPIAMFEDDGEIDAKIVKTDAKTLINCTKLSKNEALMPVYYQLSQAEREKIKTSKLNIRNATQDDLKFLIELEGEVKANGLNQNQLKEILQNKNYIAKIAQLNDTPVGFIILQITDEVNIVNIVTDKNMRNLGIATSLIAEAENVAKENKLDTMSLEVNYSNIPAFLLYKKLGFSVRRVRKNYYEDGQDCLEMVKILNN